MNTLIIIIYLAGSAAAMLLQARISLYAAGRGKDITNIEIAVSVLFAGILSLIYIAIYLAVRLTGRGGDGKEGNNEA